MSVFRVARSWSRARANLSNSLLVRSRVSTTYYMHINAFLRTMCWHQYSCAREACNVVRDFFLSTCNKRESRAFTRTLEGLHNTGVLPFLEGAYYTESYPRYCRRFEERNNVRSVGFPKQEATFWRDRS